MYGPHPGAAFFPLKLGYIAALKGIKKDAEVPEHMFNACIGPKENITGYRRGSPAQKGFIYTLERSTQHQGFFLKLHSML